MTTRSLILSPHEISAALAGTLGLVVRPVTPQPTNGLRWNVIIVNGYGGWTDEHGKPFPCPLGVPGTRLVCKETWAELDGGVTWKATEPDSLVEPPGWRSPATMPAWASRITLEVVGVRCCRLHQLCEDDMRKAYGISMATPASHDFYKQLRTSFEAVWDKHNAKRGFAWDRNPWAWAVGVRRVEG